MPGGNFPINLRWVQQYQQMEPSLMSKYECGAYHKGYFGGGGNNYLSVITCKDKIVIPSKLQTYVLHWYKLFIP